MIVRTEINGNLVTDETHSDNILIFASNDAGDACPGFDRHVGMSMDDQSSGWVIPGAVFEGSQCHLTPSWLSSSLLCVLGGICPQPLIVQLWFVP